MQTAAQDGMVINLQNAVSSTAAVSTILAIPSSFNRHNFMIGGSSGVASGAVQIETSNDPADAGTWAPLTASPTTVVASTKVLVAYTGVLNFVRARVSTAIGSGTVTVDYEGGKQ